VILSGRYQEREGCCAVAKGENKAKEKRDKKKNFLKKSMS
jgi:hypothetical protein